MVLHYNALPYSQKHSSYPAGQPWQWPGNYHTPPNHQFFGEMEAPHAHPQMYYSPHHMFHATAGAAASEWHSPTPSAENFPQNTASAHQMLHHVNGSSGTSGAPVGGGGGASGSTSSASSGSSSASAGPNSGNTQLNESASSLSEQHIAEGLPSPPITVSGSEISSPGAPASSSSPHHIPHHLANNNNSPSANNNNTTAHNNNRSSPVKAQYYDWMKKPAYPAQPTPGNYTDAELCTTPSLDDFTDFMDPSGKTRTKDKYRVVYTDFQRLELEKEYCTSRYITIRRKTELAQTLSLSERQVKIWFQNRRAKERKQNKKGSDPTSMGGIQGHNDYANMMDAKPKLEPGLHLQHSLHSMNHMAMSMSSMAMHHLHPGAQYPSLAVQAHSHQLHQSQHSAQMSAAAASSIGTLTM